MEQKLAILAELLEDYNEGRRKSFYCLAVTLLPLAELETVMTGLRTLNPAMPERKSRRGGKSAAGSGTAS